MSKVNAPARAAELFGTSGLLCAEGVLQALCERYGRAGEFAPRMASGFCAGVSRTGGMCGALSGAIMAIGLLHGRDNGQGSLDTVYAMVQELLAGFEARFGNLTCAGLTGVDFRTAEGQRSFRERNLKQNLCIPIASTAAEMAQRMLDEFEAARGE